MQTTTLTITDRTLPTGIPIEDAIVRVFDEAGSMFVTQGTTDDDGEVVFELEDDTTYWVRFFKPGYQFDTRLTIDVSSTLTNNFSVRGTYLLENPPSANEFLCRVSGYIRGADWAPRSSLSVTFSGNGAPRVLGGQVMVLTDVIAISDEDGWIECELPRGGCFDANVAGMTEEHRVKVPDSQAVSFTDLIWWYVARLDYGDDELEVEVGSTVSTSCTATLSSGVTTPFEMENNEPFLVSQFIDFDIDDESIVEIGFDVDDNIVLTGISPGTTTITASVKENIEAPRLPSPTRVLTTLTVTVTE